MVATKHIASLSGRPDLEIQNFYSILTTKASLYPSGYRFWWSVMTFFQKLPTQIGLPTRQGMGVPRTPPESRLAWWALGPAA